MKNRIRIILVVILVFAMFILVNRVLRNNKLESAVNYKTWEEPITGMDFIWVPGGCFEMGCFSYYDECFEDERPLHQVCVKGFWISKYEVTQGQWLKVMRENPSFFKFGTDYPVDQVSWNDSKEFIKTLSFLNSQKNTFALPTEAQWEYACRSGGKNEKFCGADLIDDFAWYVRNSGGQSHPIGTKKANSLGIYDMTGNVREWCEDARQS